MNDGSDVLQSHPVSADRDIVNTKYGAMTRAEAEAMRAASPDKKPTTVSKQRDIQKQLAMGQITEKMALTLQANLYRPADQQLPVPDFEAAVIEERADLQAQELGGAVQAVEDRLQNLAQRYREGHKIQDHSLKMLTDGLMQVLSLTSKFELNTDPAVLGVVADLSERIDQMKYEARMGNAVQRLGR